MEMLGWAYYNEKLVNSNEFVPKFIGTHVFGCRQ